MDVSLPALFLRLILSMGVVLVLLRVAAGAMQRSGGGGRNRRRGRAEVEVLLRQPLGRRASIGVVRAGDRALVVGITDHTITLLAEGDPDLLVPLLPESPRTATPAGGPPATFPTWTTVVGALRERTVRRP
jgi:flagellar protein FliO/FliZ